ncbi:MAG: hypothetical protein ACE5F1_04125 [Planctomycetota bacterium]
MDPKSVLAKLARKSKRTSVEELKKKGRKEVRTIRATDIALMIREAVNNAIAESEYVAPEKVEELVETAKAKFKELQREWAQEHRIAEARESESKILHTQVGELESELQELRERQDKLRSQEGVAPALPGQAHGAPVPVVSSEAEDALAQKLEAIAGSLDEKLEKMGKKLGISAAVGDEEVNLEGLFNEDLEGDMESNMDSVEVKKRQGGGIAANLDRIRKLKGG